jgi:heme-degrading monooxygenase HmoA
MVVIVFRARVREESLEKLNRVGERMYELASAMPGFLSYKDFAAEDGESVSIIEFDTLENVTAWRDHPEHREAQALGRSELFSEFTIQVCEEVRTSRHPRTEG